MFLFLDISLAFLNTVVSLALTVPVLMWETWQYLNLYCKTRSVLGKTPRCHKFLSYAFLLLTLGTHPPMLWSCYLLHLLPVSWNPIMLVILHFLYENRNSSQFMIPRFIISWWKKLSNSSMLIKRHDILEGFHQFGAHSDKSLSWWRFYARERWW